jgi:hypothetical protein
LETQKRKVDSLKNQKVKVTIYKNIKYKKEKHNHAYQYIYIQIKETGTITTFKEIEIYFTFNDQIKFILEILMIGFRK